MSGPRLSIIPARAAFDLTLTATQIRVLAALGAHSDNEGWCYPHQKTIADKIGATRQTVAAAIAKLVVEGYIEVRAKTAPGRGKVGNLYRVVLDLPPREDEPQTPVSKEADTGAARVASGRQRVRKSKGRNPCQTEQTSGPMSAQFDTERVSDSPPLKVGESDSPPSARGRDPAALYRAMGGTLPLPDGFALSDAGRAFAKDVAHIPVDRIDSEFGAFCDWHRARGIRRSDWDAAWQAWARKYGAIHDGRDQQHRDPVGTAARASAGAGAGSGGRRSNRGGISRLIERARAAREIEERLGREGGS